MFRVTLDDMLVGEGLAAVQAHLLIVDALDLPAPGAPHAADWEAANVEP